MEAWREELYHSAKGTSWKKHKYIKKDGNRYIYKSQMYNPAEEVIKSPDMQSFAKDLDKYKPIKAIREIFDIPIYDPDGEDLIDKGKKEISKLFDKKDKDTKLAKK